MKGILYVGRDVEKGDPQHPTVVCMKAGLATTKDMAMGYSA